MGLENLEYFLAILEVGLVACRSERRGGCAGHHFDVVAGFLGKVEKFLIDDAGHAVVSAIDQLNVTEFAGFENNPGHRLIDDGGRAAALGNQHLAAWHGPAFGSVDRAGMIFGHVSRSVVSITQGREATFR